MEMDKPMNYAKAFPLETLPFTTAHEDSLEAESKII